MAPQIPRQEARGVSWQDFYSPGSRYSPVKAAYIFEAAQALHKVSKSSSCSSAVCLDISDVPCESDENKEPCRTVPPADGMDWPLRSFTVSEPPAKPYNHFAAQLLPPLEFRANTSFLKGISAPRYDGSKYDKRKRKETGWQGYAIPERTKPESTEFDCSPSITSLRIDHIGESMSQTPIMTAIKSYPNILLAQARTLTTPERPRLIDIQRSASIVNGSRKPLDYHTTLCRLTAQSIASITSPVQGGKRQSDFMGLAGLHTIADDSNWQTTPPASGSAFPTTTTPDCCDTGSGVSSVSTLDLPVPLVERTLQSMKILLPLLESFIFGAEDGLMWPGLEDDLSPPILSPLAVQRLRDSRYHLRPRAETHAKIRLSLGHAPSLPSNLRFEPLSRNTAALCSHPLRGPHDRFSAHDCDHRSLEALRTIVPKSAWNLIKKCRALCTAEYLVEILGSIITTEMEKALDKVVPPKACRLLGLGTSTSERRQASLPVCLNSIKKQMVNSVSTNFPRFPNRNCDLGGDQYQTLQQASSRLCSIRPALQAKSNQVITQIWGELDHEVKDSMHAAFKAVVRLADGYDAECECACHWP